MQSCKHQLLLWALTFWVSWLTLSYPLKAQQNETERATARGLIVFELPWTVEAKVEVNLTAKLINLAAKSIRNTIEGIETIQMLDGIYVRTYDRKTVDEKELVTYFEKKLKEDKWERLFKIQEENETVEINLLFDENVVCGIFVTIIPEMPEEVTFVNVIGKIQPERLEELLQNMSSFGAMNINISGKLREQATPTGNIGQRELLGVKIDTPPKLDGILDDICWKIAPQADGFTHSYYNSPVEDASVVKLVYTTEAIYLGWEVSEPQPDKIIARQTPEPERMWGIKEDWVSLDIDLFHTHQEGDEIWFMVNPYGIKRVLIPGTFKDRFDRERTDKWNVATKILADRWVVEMEIPWHILDYPETTEPIQIGINFQRVQAYTRTHSSWSHIGYPGRPEENGHWTHILLPQKTPTDIIR